MTNIMSDPMAALVPIVIEQSNRGERSFDIFSRLLCDGILRARYRNDPARPEPLTPSQVYEFVVDLWDTANTFKAGHRIRVAITSSCFPRFDRNLNTGGVFGAEAKGQVAINTVFHDAMRPSRIILPVVE